MSIINRSGDFRTIQWLVQVCTGLLLFGAAAAADPVGPAHRQAVAVRTGSWLDRAQSAQARLNPLRFATRPAFRMSLGGAWIGSTDPREHQYLVERQELRLTLEASPGRE